MSASNRSLTAAPDRAAGALPVPLTSFVGREQQVAELARLLDTTRLVSVTGAGGCGKTRIAVAVANAVQRAFRDSVWMVELGALREPALVPQAVTTVLGLREQPGRPLSETLAEFLSSRQLLLILDNCEHLLAACADLVQRLLSACPNVRILATSREPLHIAGELVWRVPPLSLPEAVSTPWPDSVRAFEAIRLFLERARLRRPQFDLTAASAAAVAQICRRLDGIPLAIELAAARIEALSAQEIAARLDDRFRLLVGGSRDAPARQQTLRATVDWSYDLLSEAEQVLYGRLAVFAGAFGLEAAEQVCGAGTGEEATGQSADDSAMRSGTRGEQQPALLDLLQGLVEKSMVAMEERNGRARYRLLETLREYGRERLAALGETELLHRRHVEYYLVLAGAAEPQFVGPEQMLWLERLDGEHENLRQALGWLRDEGEAEAGLRLVGALWRFWEMRGYLDEGLGWLDCALAAGAGSSRARAAALLGAGALATQQGDYRRASALIEEGLALSRERGDQLGQATALCALGKLAELQGDYARATALLDESLAMNRELGHRWGTARCLSYLGTVATRQGDYAQAAALHQESLALFRALGDRRSFALVLNNLANVTRERGEYAQARLLYEECLVVQRELGDEHGIASTLGNLGIAAWRQGEYARAQELTEESLAIARASGQLQGVAGALTNLGGIAQERGDVEQAARYYEECLSLFQAMAHKPGVAILLTNLGTLAAQRGEYSRAQPLFAESLTLKRELGDKAGIAKALHGLAMLAVEQGDTVRAAGLLEEALETKRALHDAAGIVASLLGSATIAAIRHAPERAARLLGAAEALHVVSGTALSVVDRPYKERTLAAARGAGRGRLCGSVGRRPAHDGGAGHRLRPGGRLGVSICRG
jgi:non-specific serine/threonine protein kinase